MTRRERIAQQRVMMRQALGLLEGIGELFGVDAEADVDPQAESEDWERWKAGVDDIRDWLEGESPIA